MQKLEFIAEVGSTHDGSFGNAKRMVSVFAAHGATCIKFQDHRWQQVPHDAPRPAFFADEDRARYFERISFEGWQWGELRDECTKHGVDFMVSCFSFEAARAQYELGVRKFKIASGQVTNRRMLEYLGRMPGVTLYVSQGMATQHEFAIALGSTTAHLLRSPDEMVESFQRIKVMACASDYPQTVMPEFRRLHGFSDHCPPGIIGPACAAAAHGLHIFERHVTLSRHLYGSDAWNALLPEEFRDYVRNVTAAYDAAHNTESMDARAARLEETRRVFLHKETAA